MPFVVDASVAASWFLPDERPAQTKAAYALLASDHAVVPTLWWYEIRNVFVMSERRGRMDRDQTDAALMLLRDVSIEQDDSRDDRLLLALARHHRLSIYDASYLELARRREIALATLDRALARAAQAEKVPLIG
jgi:predicted nucleic acid-binding protein